MLVRVAGYITSFGSDEWGSPSAWPASWTATARSALSGKGMPVLVPERQRDDRTANVTGLVPRQIGLAGAVEVEAIDPANDDVRIAGVPHDVEPHADTK